MKHFVSWVNERKKCALRQFFFEIGEVGAAQQQGLHAAGGKPVRQSVQPVEVHHSCSCSKSSVIFQVLLSIFRSIFYNTTENGENKNFL